MPRKKRPRGAPKGNQNARKHGFYSKALTEAERLELQNARGIDGIDEEIALLRVKIQALIALDPDNIVLLLEAANTLARLARTQYRLDKKEAKGLRDAIVDVVQHLAVPVGVAAGVALHK